MSALRHLRQAGAIIALALIALTFGGLNLASAETQSWGNNPVKRPYIFTQQNNIEGRPDVMGRVQLIRLGWPLQVQLPGNPAVWTFAPQDSKLVEPRGRTMVFSPSRIEDTQSIFVFDFALSPDAKAGDTGIITLTTGQLPDSLNKVMPLGIFSMEFSVINPN